MEDDPATAPRLLESVTAKYVIVDETTHLEVNSRHVGPTIRHNPGSWWLVHTIPGSRTYVYRRAE
jgi:hypothetical protein